LKIPSTIGFFFAPAEWPCNRRYPQLERALAGGSL
jgi:hypothetical protein